MSEPVPVLMMPGACLTAQVPAPDDGPVEGLGRASNDAATGSLDEGCVEGGFAFKKGGGAEDEIRTRDPVLGKDVLYR